MVKLLCDPFHRKFQLHSLQQLSCFYMSVYNSIIKTHLQFFPVKDSHFSIPSDSAFLCCSPSNHQIPLDVPTSPSHLLSGSSCSQITTSELKPFPHDTCQIVSALYKLCVFFFSSFLLSVSVPVAKARPCTTLSACKPPLTHVLFAPGPELNISSMYLLKRKCYKL